MHMPFAAGQHRRIPKSVDLIGIRVRALRRQAKNEEGQKRETTKSEDFNIYN